MKRNSAPPLRVAILGGGPAGAFCAIWLGELSRRGGPEVEAIVFDHKDFDQPGPAGCNMCAGIIPDSLVRNMGAMGLDLPPHVIQRRLQGYLLETAGGAVDIPAPAGARLYATFRGPGPLGIYPAAQEGFDWWLLGEARKRGALHLSKLVTDLRLPAEPGAPYLVMCRDGATFEADVVVGAFGVSGNLGGVFERLGFGYRAPKTVRARQAELPLDPDFIERHLRNRVLIFAGGMPGLRFAAITPKRQHVTVTLIGRDLGRPDMERFLDLPAVRKHLPRGWTMGQQCCSCAPRLPISAARHPVFERLLVIGDANISRYLKNGIESSFYTAQWAARAIARGQVGSAELARRYYLAPARRAYAMDNAYGRLLLRLHDLISRSVVITRAHIVVARKEQAGALPGRLLTEVLWGMFTGNIPYRAMLHKAFSPRLQARLLAELALTAAHELLPARPLRPMGDAPPTSSLGPLGSQQTAIIIGGGPAGASCAMTLAREGTRLRRAPRIILVEQKRFGEHQNQCAGVISLPGLEAMHDLLGVEVPRDLIQRDLRGYVLHADGNAIDLSGDELGEGEIALRRVQLDRILLEAAQRCGVEVVHARASAVEVNRDGVVAYTDSGTFHGDVVIGAFGLDRGIAQEFARGTRYRIPAALETLACKLHPGGLDHIPELLGDFIHVFLPPERRLEFGALIPKSNHVTVVVAGQGLRETDMTAFLTRYGAQLLPPA
jgi:flavin-dependent dehydrogenase